MHATTRCPTMTDHKHGPWAVPRNLKSGSKVRCATCDYSMRLGEKCRPGCVTLDHFSYAECCRGIQFDAKGTSRTFQQQSTNKELAAYRAARSEGIQPQGTRMAQVEAAKRISDATGVAYGV